ncbi:MAG: hypothetical protein P8130_04165 [Deltaproteobacteria bacterium]
MKLIMAFAIASILSIPISCFAGPFQCIEGDCVNGFGTYELPLGAKYIGEFKNRKYHGKGTYIFHDGTKNSGTWIDGKQEGKGTVVYPDGKVKYIHCDNGKCE